jgi:DNA polymerase III gamma/tau subunit
VNRDQVETVQAVADELSARDLQRAIRAVQTARSQVAGAINSRMALEVLMLRLPALRA